MMRAPQGVDQVIVQVSGPDAIDLTEITHAVIHDPGVEVIAMIDASNAQDWMHTYQTSRYCRYVDAIAIDCAQVASYADSPQRIMTRLARLRRLSKPIDLCGYPADAPDIPGVRYAYTTTETEWTSTPLDSESPLPLPSSSSES